MKGQHESAWSRRAVSLLLGVVVTLTACERTPRRDASVQWPTACPPIPRPAPLSLDGARQAQRQAERRRELRLHEAAAPGTFLREMSAELDAQQIAAGRVCLSLLADRGELLFEHEYGFSDGLGGGDSARASRGPFRRVHSGLFGGPETVSCPSCHWVGGPNGAGAETDNAFLDGDGSRTASGDERNPPALVALGVVQALAREMTRDLQRQRDALLAGVARGGTERQVSLRTKDVDFGVLRVTATGEIDPSGIRGVDADLVLKPFGWKGTLADFTAFASEALQVHIGIQSDALLASAGPALLGTGSDRADPDEDGVRGELARGPLAAMSVHLALLELPIIEPLIQSRRLAPAAKALLAPTTTSFAGDFQRGRTRFHALGCASCHVPMMVLQTPVLEVEGLPRIDLAAEMREPALIYDPSLDGYPVWLFSDLKRHDMGKANAARHLQRGVALNEYLTPRLWGLAESAPYLHDGRAPSLDYAIAGHDGEGTAARAAFGALSREDKGALRVYLTSLRRAARLIVP